MTHNVGQQEGPRKERKRRRGALDDVVIDLVIALSADEGYSYASARAMRAELLRSRGIHVGENSIPRVIKRLSKGDPQFGIGVLRHVRRLPGQTVAPRKPPSGCGGQHNYHRTRWQIRKERAREAKRRRDAEIRAERERKRRAREAAEEADLVLVLSPEQRAHLAELRRDDAYGEAAAYLAREGIHPPAPD